MKCHKILPNTPNVSFSRHIINQAASIPNVVVGQIEFHKTWRSLTLQIIHGWWYTILTIHLLGNLHVKPPNAGKKWLGFLEFARKKLCNFFSITFIEQHTIAFAFMRIPSIKLHLHFLAISIVHTRNPRHFTFVDIGNP